MDRDKIIDEIVDIQDYIMSMFNPNDPSEAEILNYIYNRLSDITDNI